MHVSSCYYCKWKQSEARLTGQYHQYRHLLNVTPACIPLKYFANKPGAACLMIKTNSLPVTLCRICLEVDSIESLDIPCACSGTQRYAHQTCIQRWVEEKGRLRCEVCGQEYKGNYTAPPPKATTNAHPHASLEDASVVIPMLPMLISDPGHPTTTNRMNTGGPAQGVLVWEEENTDRCCVYTTPHERKAFYLQLFFCLLVFFLFLYLEVFPTNSAAPYDY